MSTQEDLKKKIREAYNADKAGKKPATLKYVALFVVIVLVAVLFFMTTSVGQNLLGGNGVSVPKNAQEAAALTNNLHDNLGGISNTLSSLSNSLGK